MPSMLDVMIMLYVSWSVTDNRAALTSTFPRVYHYTAVMYESPVYVITVLMNVVCDRSNAISQVLI